MTSDREPEPLRYRRRAPRVKTPGWAGKFVIEDEPGTGWGDCRILDISLLGLGLELSAPVPADLIGRRVVVHVEVAGSGSISLRLVGAVKRVGAGEPGSTRAGLEFEGLSEAERSVLQVIEHLKVGW
jgi:c-di-GMP-binding flagellar brake protein YcgR